MAQNRTGADGGELDHVRAVVVVLSSMEEGGAPELEAAETLAAGRGGASDRLRP